MQIYIKNMSKIKKMEKILVSPKEIKIMMDIFGCTKSMVYNALAFRSNSSLASDIRTAALKTHGGVLTKVPIVVD